MTFHQVSHIRLIDDCKDFSFPLPIPKGSAPIQAVKVGGVLSRFRYLNDNVLIVQGSAPFDDPVHLAVQVSIDPRDAVVVVEPNRYVGIRAGGTLIPCPTPDTSVVIDGFRYTAFVERFEGGSTMALEVSNAEWVEGGVHGPRIMPRISGVFTRGADEIDSEVVQWKGKTLNPREHVVIRLSDSAHLIHGRHLVQSKGEWSYKNIKAWGPQEILIPNPEIVSDNLGIHSSTIGGDSPLRTVGYAGGNGTGGFLIEYSFRPMLSGTPMQNLLVLSDAMTERQPIWAFFDGEVFDPSHATLAYQGDIPYRAELTNIPETWDGKPMMIPEFLKRNWTSRDVDEVGHGWKPHDGQHMVRATAMLKSCIWNTGDRYSIHALKQIAAHARLCKTHLAHRNVGWSHENSVYGALNWLHPSKKGRGFAVGKREDAWTLEAIVMDQMISPSSDANAWLQGYSEVILENILATGVGISHGNNIVQGRCLTSNGYISTAPGHEPITDGRGVIQTFEIEHFAHALHCMSNLEGFEDMGQFVEAASDLIESAMVQLNDGSRSWAPYWYLKVANEEGVAFQNVTSSTGYSTSPTENWYGMCIHSYAENGSAMTKMYPHGVSSIGGNAETLDRKQVAIAYLDRDLHVAPSALATSTPSDPDPDPPIIDPPTPPVEVDWKARHDALVVRARSIVNQLQQTIRDLTEI